MDEWRKRQIYLDLCRNPRRSYEDIGKDNKLSASTIRCVAACYCLYRFIMKWKPHLTPRQRMNRLQWAADNEGKDWTSVIFTDEAMVRIGDQGRQ